MTTALLAVFAATYVARIAFFFRGFYRERSRWQPNIAVPTVTVLVPARNEAENIERCVNSLLSVDYPVEKLEVIIVDDRSSDATPEILDRLASGHSVLKVLHRTPQEVDPNLRGKAGALQYGIDHAAGEIIVMTDADCIVNPQWIRAMVSPFADPKVGIVNALTSVSGDGFFDRIQDVEWTYTEVMACGGVGNNTPLGCFGNNLAIRRDVFNGLGGYRKIPFSVTEDMALQLAVHEAGHTVRYLIRPDITVETNPCTTLLEYIKQHHRWVRGGTGLGMRAFWFVLTSMALWAGFALSAVTGSWIWFWSFLALRLLADGALISSAALSIGRPRIIPMIIPAMLLLMSTELFLPILALKKQVTWKGQVFKN